MESVSAREGKGGFDELRSKVDPEIFAMWDA